MAALQRAEQPGNEYLLISQQGVTALLRRLGAVPPELELLRLRDACGYEAVPTAHAVRAHLRLAGAGPVCGPALADAPLLDFSGDDPPPPASSRRSGATSRTAASTTRRRSRPSCPASGARCTSASTCSCPRASRSWRRSTGPCAPSRSAPSRATGAGSSCSTTRRRAASRFHTLYGHLSKASAERLAPGDAIRRGDEVGRLGAEAENGGWAPHLHLQLLTTDLGRGSDAHGVGTLAERDLWESVSPDPNLLLGLPGGVRADPPRDREQLLAARRTTISPGAQPVLRGAAEDRPRRRRPPLRRATGAPTSTSSTTSATSATPIRAWSPPRRRRWRG